MGLLSKADRMFPPGSSKASWEKPDTAEPAGIGKKIAQFHRMHPEFNCLVLENPPKNNSGENFCKTVSAIIDKAGSVIPLPSGRPLILFPLAADCELIAHRLSKMLSAKTLLLFKATSPASALSRLNPLL